MGEGKYFWNNKYHWVISMPSFILFILFVCLRFYNISVLQRQPVGLTMLLVVTTTTNPFFIMAILTNDLQSGILLPRLCGQQTAWPCISILISLKLKVKWPLCNVIWSYHLCNLLWNWTQFHLLKVSCFLTAGPKYIMWWEHINLHTWPN